MPEYTEGHKPTAGELQARAAEKIIEDAQRKTHRANFDAARLFGANTHDRELLEKARGGLHDEFGRKRWRGDGNVITPHGVATNHEELEKVFAEGLKQSNANFERQRREAVARLNTFWRLPFGEKLSMLISGAPTDQDKYNEILEQERKRQGL